MKKNKMINKSKAGTKKISGRAGKKVINRFLKGKTLKR